MMGERMKGIVCKLIGEKNFGFIRHDGAEYFFHRDSFNGHWDDLMYDVEISKDGVQVEFEPSHSPKGPRAENVRRFQHPNEG